MKPKHIAVTAIAAFVLYLAAYGPLYRAFTFGNTPESIRTAIETAYTPLWWVADHSEPLDRAVSAYEIWWCEAW